jgi:hypothetical protein
MGGPLAAALFILLTLCSIAAVVAGYTIALVSLRAYAIMIMQAELAHYFWPFVAGPFTALVLPLIYFVGHAAGSDVLWTAGGILIMSSVAWLFGEIGHTVLIAVAAALDLKRRAPPLLNPILRWHLRRNLNRWPGIYSAVGRRLGVDGLAERWHLAVQPERA